MQIIRRAVQMISGTRKCNILNRKRVFGQSKKRDSFMLFRDGQRPFSKYFIMLGIYLAHANFLFLFFYYFFHHINIIQIGRKTFATAACDERNPMGTSKKIILNNLVMESKDEKKKVFPNLFFFSLFFYPASRQLWQGIQSEIVPRTSLVRMSSVPSPSSVSICGMNTSARKSMS